MDWDLITNITLASSLAMLAVFVFLGLYQWVTRKSLKKIDRELRWFPLPLALAAITYIIFDHFIILNTRPNGSGEPSFPSTHVMIVTTILFVIMLILPKYVKSKPIRIIIEILMVAIISLTCIGRVFANMHWASDVVGSVVFAFIFSEIYRIVIKKGAKNAKHFHQDHQE